MIKKQNDTGRLKKSFFLQKRRYDSYKKQKPKARLKCLTR